MIEFATSDNGPTDLPLKVLPNGTILPEGDLQAMHASFQRGVIYQVRKGMLAEALGFHYFFLTEHHFQPEGAEFSPNPLIIDAAVATRTRRIRLGQMANILPWHHPIRLAEQAAMVDIISGGRLEFGIGRGIQPRETEIFGQVYGSSGTDDRRNRLYTDECMEIILKAWTEPSFSYHGEFFSIPPRWTPHHHPMTLDYFSQPGVGRTLDQVVQVGEPTGAPAGIRTNGTVLKELSVFPQPLQKPHPQIWQPVVSGKDSLQAAARKGYNATIGGADFERARQGVDAYYESAEAHGFPDYHDRGKFKRGWDCQKKRGVGLLIYLHIVDHGIGNAEKHLLGRRHLMTYLGGYGGGAARNRGETEQVEFCGSVGQVVDSVMRLKETAGYEDFLGSFGFGGAGMNWEEEEEQMRAFAQDVMPVLQRECGGSPDLPASELPW